MPGPGSPRGGHHDAAYDTSHEATPPRDGGRDPGAHLEALTDGATDAWRTWRKQHPDVATDSDEAVSALNEIANEMLGTYSRHDLRSAVQNPRVWELRGEYSDETRRRAAVARAEEVTERSSAVRDAAEHVKFATPDGWPVERSNETVECFEAHAKTTNEIDRRQPALA